MFVTSQWKKHWFVLTDAGLKYYRDSSAEEVLSVFLVLKCLLHVLIFFVSVHTNVSRCLFCFNQ